MKPGTIKVLAANDGIIINKICPHCNVEGL